MAGMVLLACSMLSAGSRLVLLTDHSPMAQFESEWENNSMLAFGGRVSGLAQALCSFSNLAVNRFCEHQHIDWALQLQSCPLS